MTEALVKLLGGEEVFGAAPVSAGDFFARVVRGLPSRSLSCVLERLGRDGMGRREIYAVVGSARTLQRKRQHQTRLSPDESDRLGRVARIAVRACAVLGSAGKGVRWLGTANRSINGATPLALLATDPGVILVEALLGRIEHGVPS